MRAVAAAGVTMAALLAVAQPAAAIERVADGGFENATCSPGDCTSPVWAETVTGVSADGPICRAGTGQCTSNQGAPAAGSTWARLAYTFFSNQSPTGTLQQNLEIPGAPAVLRFKLRIQPSGVHTGTLVAKVDGAPVFSVTEATPGYATYQPVSVDVSSHAGSGTHTLRFEAAATWNGVNSGFSSSFSVDDVSLDAADKPPDPVVEAGTCNDRTATQTGTENSELIVGTSGPDIISALGGDDVVKGKGGNDVICGGAGKDELRGDAGKDRLIGDTGKDKLKGGDGRDTCDGGGGKDKASACERGPDA